MWKSGPEGEDFVQGSLRQCWDLQCWDFHILILFLGRAMSRGGPITEHHEGHHCRSLTTLMHENQSTWELSFASPFTTLLWFSVRLAQKDILADCALLASLVGRNFDRLPNKHNWSPLSQIGYWIWSTTLPPQLIFEISISQQEVAIEVQIAQSHLVTVPCNFLMFFLEIAELPVTWGYLRKGEICNEEGCWSDLPFIIQEAGNGTDFSYITFPFH